MARIDWVRQDGVAYTLEWGGTLEDFTPVPAGKILPGDGHEVDITGMSKRFFRVIVGE